MPRFTVCIPTYNGADYLGDAINSVLVQTFDNFELLICDDASTDESADLVASFDDSRIRYLSFDENLGQSGNFNRCINHSTGGLWTMLSADDRLMPEFLERARDALDKHAGTGFFVSAFERIDPDGNRIGYSRPWEVERVVEAGGLLSELLQGAYFMTLGLVLRQEALGRVGPFRTDVTWGHDWDWVLRLLSQEGGIYSPDPLAQYRVHPGSGTAAALQGGNNGAAELQILREALHRTRDQIDRAGRQRALRAFSIRQLYYAKLALDAGTGSAGMKNLRHGVAASPWIITRLTFWRLLVRAGIQLVRRSPGA